LLGRDCSARVFKDAQDFVLPEPFRDLLVHLPRMKFDNW
jgi:hypothetical protein